MRGLIVEVSPVSENTSIAHVRNSVYAAKQFGFDICWNDETILKSLRKKYDVLLFSYSSKFAPHELMAKLIDNNQNAKLLWMINEYNGSVPKCLRDAGGVTVIANFDMVIGKDYEYVSQWHNIDINSWMTFDKQTINAKKYNSVYYGTWRPGKAKYLEKYMTDGVLCSSSAKNHKFFRDAGCSPKFIEKLSWQKNRETLSLFGASLYIEDVFTHSHYNRMSNRFYEAVSCNAAPVFDVSCVGTIKKSGYAIPDSWIVDSASDLINVGKKEWKTDISSLYDAAKEQKTIATQQFVSVVENAANRA